MKLKAFGWPHFEVTHARTNDPETSKEAARSMSPFVRSLMTQILLCLKSNPKTQSEVASITGLKEQQVWKRISDLKNQGLVEDSGFQRPGSSGRKQTVWKAV